MIRYSIIVTGRVQGVGFRYFLQLNASMLNLTGWCKNLMTGDVEVEIQGLEKDVFNFVATLKKGNGFSKVHDIDIKTLSIINNEKKFSIIY